ncbi:MAG: hypothetical protein WGN25_01260 [Candidatus Electrothrix sp. GW3-4]|uniref:hypothetical protein n=1 Tax=Candidatus Electrothrix sp. GW3-4 TaxID=3126740 RepID=UPI0030CAE118
MIFEEEHMSVSDWLDEKAAEGVDVSQIELPADVAFNEDPDETIFFKEILPCTFLCPENHPFSKVQRFGHWYSCTGQDKKAGIHSTKMKWRLFTKDKEQALQVARAHIE